MLFALSDIIFPAKTNQGSKNEMKVFSSEGLKFYEKIIPIDAVSRPYRGEQGISGIGSYKNCDRLLRSLKTATGLTHLEYLYNKINGGNSSFFAKNEGIIFPDNKIPSILDFNGIQDGSRCRIGYKIFKTSESLAMADNEEYSFVDDYPFDLSVMKQLLFVYVNIIEYQNVGDTKAPLIHPIDSKIDRKTVALRNRANTQNWFQQHGKEKISKNSETRQLFPNAVQNGYNDFQFSKKIEWIEAYYQQQSVSPYF